MSSGPRSELLRQFRTLFEAGTVAALTDGQLLERFLENRNEAGEVAFAALVARHGPMVLGVCHRALADPNDAADAFQATFLVLVRKARSIRVDDSLGRWLYGVSRRVAIRARTVAARRARSGPEGIESIAAVATDPDRFELEAMLDEELARLPESFRSALVLCDLGGLTHEEAARDLVCPVGTIKSRLSRGRKRLREQLERRGYAPSAMILAPTVPASLASATVRASILSSISGSMTAGMVSASSIILAQGVLKSMNGITLKLAASAVLALGVAATGAGVLAQVQAEKAKPLTDGKVKTELPVDPASSKIDAKLNQPVTLNIKDQPLFEAVNFLREYTGLTIVLDVQSLAAEGLTELTRVSLTAREIKLKHALKYLLGSAGLTYRVEDQVIRIMSALPDRGGPIWEKLNEPVTLNVTDMPLREVIALFRAQTGVSITLDSKVPDAHDLKETRVTLAVESAKLADALKTLLEPLRLSFRVVDDVLLITSPTVNSRDRRIQSISMLYDKIDRWKSRLAKANRIAKETSDPAVIQARNEVEELEDVLFKVDDLLASADETAPKRNEIVPPANRPGKGHGNPANLPRESQKITMPEYVIEPPDIIDVEVLEGLPGKPITGERLVRPDGKISLGFYGEVYVAGLTTTEVKKKVAVYLQEYLDDQKLGLTRTDLETGKVKQIDPAKTYKISVDVAAYNSKVYYVQGDVGVPGRLNITGNETVLDAINYAGGLIPTADPANIRLIRPAPPGKPGVEMSYPVDLDAIIKNGDTKTNYQIFPGDRVVVYRAPKVAPEAAKVSEPEPTNAKDVDARLHAVEQKLDEVLKVLERLPKP